jgi:hypothetical protein
VRNDKMHVEETRTTADDGFLFSSGFGTHKSVKVLSDQRGKAVVLFKKSGSVDKRGDKPNVTLADGTVVKTSLLVRSPQNSYRDDNGNDAPDADEKRATFDFAAVSERGDSGRVVVAADSDVFSDALLAFEANRIFADLMVLYLTRDDATLAAATEPDPDPAIKHTKDENKMWFYATTLLVPLAVLVVGAVIVSRRGRRRARALVGAQS